MLYNYSYLHLGPIFFKCIRFCPHFFLVQFIFFNLIQPWFFSGFTFLVIQHGYHQPKLISTFLTIHKEIKQLNPNNNTLQEYFENLIELNECGNHLPNLTISSNFLCTISSHSKHLPCPSNLHPFSHYIQFKLRITLT